MISSITNHNLDLALLLVNLAQGGVKSISLSFMLLFFVFSFLTSENTIYVYDLGLQSYSSRLSKNCERYVLPLNFEKLLKLLTETRALQFT